MKTKKTLTLLALVFLGITAAHAQIPGFTIGLKMGYTYSTMTKGSPAPEFGRYDSDVRARHAMIVSVFGRVGRGNNYFQPELNFDTQGGDFYFIPPNNISYHVISRVNRFDIPLLYGRKFALSKTAIFRINVGPEVSLRVHSVNRHLGYIPTNYQFKTANIGAIGGIGADFGKVTFDVRYDLGITKANRAFDSRLNTASVTVGYKFF